MDNIKLWRGSKKNAFLRMSFYGRYNSMQIGKDVMRVLGAPPYIAIRVNREMNSLLIEGAVEKHKLSFKVPSDIYENHNRQMIINSMSFVISMMTLNNMDLAETYTIEGVYSEKNNAVVFDMNASKVYGVHEENIC